MLINFDQVLTDLKKEILKDENNENFTVGHAAIRSLMGEKPQTPMTGDQKYRQYKLALKIGGGKDAEGLIDISIEEAALIKKLVGDFYSPLVVGQVYDLIEGDKNGQ